jgi:hypothetical protein
MNELAALLGITNISSGPTEDMILDPESVITTTGFTTGRGFAEAVFMPLAAAAAGISPASTGSSTSDAATGITTAPSGGSVPLIFSTASEEEFQRDRNRSRSDGVQLNGPKSRSKSDSDSSSDGSSNPSGLQPLQGTNSPAQGALDSDDELLGNAMAKMSYSSDSEEGTPNPVGCTWRTAAKAESLILLQSGAGSGSTTPLASPQQPLFPPVQTTSARQLTFPAIPGEKKSHILLEFILTMSTCLHNCSGAIAI